MADEHERLVRIEEQLQGVVNRLKLLEERQSEHGPKILRLEIDYSHLHQDVSDIKVILNSVQAGVQMIQQLVQRVRGGYAVLAVVAGIFTAIGAASIEIIKWLKGS